MFTSLRLTSQRDVCYRITPVGGTHDAVCFVNEWNCQTLPTVKVIAWECFWWSYKVQWCRVRNFSLIPMLCLKLEGDFCLGHYHDKSKSKTQLISYYMCLMVLTQFSSLALNHQSPMVLLRLWLTDMTPTGCGAVGDPVDFTSAIFYTARCSPV